MDFGLDPNAKTNTEYRLDPDRFRQSLSASSSGVAGAPATSKLESLRAATSLQKSSERLKVAARTIRQVEDLLNGALEGLRGNAAPDASWLANQRLLSSAVATARDLIESSNYDGNHLFVDKSQNLATRKALYAYSAQDSNVRSPGVGTAVADAAVRQASAYLTGPNGVLPTLTALASAGSQEQAGAEPLLERLVEDMRAARKVLDQVAARHLAPKLAGLADGPQFDAKF